MKYHRRWFAKEKYPPEESNVIQYDRMGYPLRLVIDSNGNQSWRDTYEREGDVELKWMDMIVEVERRGAE